MKLDEKDWKILEQLKENARQSVRDIAKKTGIRPSTVHERIRKLQEEKVIEKCTLKLNNTAIGEDFIVLMLVAGKAEEYIDQKLLQNKHVKDVFGVTGEYDVAIKLKFKDVQEFNDFVLKFRKEHREITKTLTMVVTVNLKEEM